MFNGVQKSYHAITPERQKSGSQKDGHCQTTTIQQGHDGSRGILIVGSCYLAMPGEDKEALMFGVVIYKMCKSLMPLHIVMYYTCSINLITN